MKSVWHLRLEDEKRMKSVWHLRLARTAASSPGSSQRMITSIQWSSSSINGAHCDVEHPQVTMSESGYPPAPEREHSPLFSRERIDNVVFLH